jgi:pyruvate/2-oxoglutarate dehydrogenase complex dihydrolipoamide dehydrogenase (E3) component
VIATGSQAFVTQIAGIDSVRPLTNETIFNLTETPSHLIVIGGGPIGIELAQAHSHLGAHVSVLAMYQIMPKDDPELVNVVRQQLIEDGVDIYENVTVRRVDKTINGMCVVISKSGVKQSIEGSHLLVSAGRRPNVGELALEKAGVVCSPKGIEVDAHLRTSNKKNCHRRCSGRLTVYAYSKLSCGYCYQKCAVSLTPKS